MFGSNAVNEDSQNTSPWVQVVGRDTLGAQNVHQQTAKVLEISIGSFEIVL